jgi:3-phosphoshikimate 1-carboxyvinyltransferase
LEIKLSPPQTFPSHHTSIDLPISKSIANRLLILGKIHGVNFFECNHNTPDDVVLLHQLLYNNRDNSIYDCKTAGTVFRFLTTYFATQINDNQIIITGSERLKQRPIEPLVSVLREFGAEIVYLEKDNFIPISILGNIPKNNFLEIDSSQSSQFATSLLLCSKNFEEGLKLNVGEYMVSKPYMDMTLSILSALNYHVEIDKNIISTSYNPTNQPITPTGFKNLMEYDWSSASFFYCICSLLPNSKFEFNNLKLSNLQGDVVLIDIFKSLGVNTSLEVNSIKIEHHSNLTNQLSFNFINCPDISIPILITCSLHNIPFKASGLDTLNLKESNRLDILVDALKKTGAVVSNNNSEIEVLSYNKVDYDQPHNLDSFGDHRLAMSWALMSIKFKNLQIVNPYVVEKSFPIYWEILENLGFEIKQFSN